MRSDEAAVAAASGDTGEGEVAVGQRRAAAAAARPDSSNLDPSPSPRPGTQAVRATELDQPRAGRRTGDARPQRSLRRRFVQHV